MNSFINKLQQPEVWSPLDYPTISDAAWEQAFDAGSDAQKANLANGWLWCVNQIMRDDDETATQLLSFPKHMGFYCKIAPYVNPAYFKNAYLDGTFFSNKLLDYTAPRDLSSQPLQHFMQCIDYLLTCPDNEKAQALIDAGEEVIMLEKNNIRFVKKYYPLLEALAWAELKRVGLSAQQDCLKAALTMTVYCGLNSHLFETVANDPRAWAWAIFSTGTLGVVPEDMASTTMREVEQLVCATDPVVAIPLLRGILKKTLSFDIHPVTGEEVNAPQVPALTILNPGDTHSTDVYGVLRRWLPQLASTWTTAQALDMNVYDAIDQAYANLGSQLVGQVLPQTITASPESAYRL